MPRLQIEVPVGSPAAPLSALRPATPVADTGGFARRMFLIPIFRASLFKIPFGMCLGRTAPSSWCRSVGSHRSVWLEFGASVLGACWIRLGTGVPLAAWSQTCPGATTVAGPWESRQVPGEGALMSLRELGVLRGCFIRERPGRGLGRWAFGAGPECCASTAAAPPGEGRRVMMVREGSVGQCAVMAASDSPSVDGGAALLVCAFRLTAYHGQECPGHHGQAGFFHFSGPCGVPGGHVDGPDPVDQG